MNFRQFALNNVKRNAGAYVGYFLSCAFVVMVFFLYATLMFHPQLEQSVPGMVTKNGMLIAEIVIYGISFLFLFYSMSVFLKERTKEIGILMILGAKPSQIYQLIFIENITIGMSAIFVGLMCGLATSKLFFMVSADVLGSKRLFFYVPVQATLLTGMVFIILFGALSILTVGGIRKNKVIHLLQGKKKTKQELYANPWLALFSLSCFVVAIGLMQVKMLAPEITITILLLGCIGTYFFYTQMSVWVIQQFQKRKPFFWKGTRLLWVSDLAHKLKDNARMFFILTIVATIAFSTIGILVANVHQSKVFYQKTPFSIEMASESHEKTAIKESMTVDYILQQRGIYYQKVITHSQWVDFQGITYGLEIIPQSDYRSLMQILHLKKDLVRDDEMILLNSPCYPPIQKVNNGAMFTRGKIHLKVKRQYEYQIFTKDNRLAVVSDHTYSQIQHSLTKEDGQRVSISYYVPAWKSNQEPREKEIKASEKIGTMISSETLFMKGSKSLDYIYDAKGYIITIYIGSFIALILSLFIVSFLYFRLFTDFYLERESYRKLIKVGVSIKELKHISTLKMAVMFFFPLIIAMMESLISLSMMKRHIGLLEIVVPSLYGIGVFFCLQLLYFLIFRSRYLKKLNQWMTITK
ncbi:FtsX-like permease family protein [Marininema halotolerans]|uniref:Putative ABC transport system permease protein n=1 Tax=Marininema halotolerans TaxID=1155944 RepID=A0A1I6SKK3_9BACL|nr:ABC transporter permease [Marininema halotolerans]SFS77390.1 putative ABC transport system permease protein [Marininema halotolerans]